MEGHLSFSPFWRPHSDCRTTRGHMRVLLGGCTVQINVYCRIKQPDYCGSVLCQDFISERLPAIPFWQMRWYVGTGVNCWVLKDFSFPHFSGLFLCDSHCLFINKTYGFRPKCRGDATK